jgi:23S rRNA pseudouridine2605 synthase
LSKLGAASRAQSRALIEAGRVRVNGRVVQDPARRVELARDRIALDGAVVRRAAPVYFALHKPRGVVTTRSDERGRPCVQDLLPDEPGHLFAVGRLDQDSSGLLLVTNDTGLVERVASPAAHVEKEYVAQVDREVTAAELVMLARAHVLADGTRLLPFHVVAGADRRTLRITIREGRNRQIRRVLEGFGFEVETLHRVRIGGVRLGDLPPGALRPLTAGEVARLGVSPASRRRGPGRRRRTRRPGPA